MNYLLRFSLIALFSIPSMTNAMHEMLKYTPPYQFNSHMNIIDEQEREDATFFVDCLNGFKQIAQKALTMEQAGYSKLSDKQARWLEFCISGNDTMQLKVRYNRYAVYKQMCSFASVGSDNTVHDLTFWSKLLEQKKIDQKLFDEQAEQRKKLAAFFVALKHKGIISESPTIQNEALHKSAL